MSTFFKHLNTFCKRLSTFYKRLSTFCKRSSTFANAFCQQFLSTFCWFCLLFVYTSSCCRNFAYDFVNVLSGGHEVLYSLKMVWQLIVKLILMKLNPTHLVHFRKAKLFVTSNSTLLYDNKARKWILSSILLEAPTKWREKSQTWEKLISVKTMGAKLHKGNTKDYSMQVFALKAN